MITSDPRCNLGWELCILEGQDTGAQGKKHPKQVELLNQNFKADYKNNQ